MVLAEAPPIAQGSAHAKQNAPAMQRGHFCSVLIEFLKPFLENLPMGMFSPAVAENI